MEVVLADKYDDIKIFLSEKERQCMDAFSGDLIGKIDERAKALVARIIDRVVDRVMSRRETGMTAVIVPETSDSRKFGAEVIAKVTRKSEVTIMWKIFNEPIHSRSLNDSSDSRDLNILLFNVAKQAIIDQLLSNINNRQKFEEQRKELLGGFSFGDYKERFKVPDYKKSEERE